MTFTETWEMHRAGWNSAAEKSAGNSALLGWIVEADEVFDLLDAFVGGRTVGLLMLALGGAANRLQPALRRLYAPKESFDSGIAGALASLEESMRDVGAPEKLARHLLGVACALINDLKPVVDTHIKQVPMPEAVPHDVLAVIRGEVAGSAELFLDAVEIWEAQADSLLYIPHERPVTAPKITRRTLVDILTAPGDSATVAARTWIASTLHPVFVHVL